MLIEKWFYFFHAGYVLEGFPILVQDPVSVENQIKFLNGLPLGPEFIINLKVNHISFFFTTFLLFKSFKI